MNKECTDFVWIFTGSGARFPSGVFLEKDSAIVWVSKHKLSGVLAKYPVDIGIYDWALKMHYFVPKRDDHRGPEFIGKFSCASLEHFHFESGLALAGS